MQPQYPQQYPPQPGYPQAPAMPQYPPQGYGQYPQAPQPYPQAPAAPAPAPTAPGSLDGFFSAPSSGGGPSFKFMDANRQPQVGKTYVGLVARPVTNGDVRQQTDTSGRPLTYKDGRPKFVMVVPMQVQPTEEFPEGIASWWVKGQARDELVRAMAEAGAPAGPPESGAGIKVTLTGTRPVPGMNPQYLYRVEYQRPAGAEQAAPAAPVEAPAPVPEQPAQAAPAQVPAQAPAAPAPAGLSDDQAALLAKLTGG